jgi:hypothetical protein
MSEIYENDEEAIRGGDPAPAPDPETAPEAPQTPQETPPEERLYAGKYKSADDLEKGYNELLGKLSSTRPAEPQQYQPPADPLAGLPPHIDEQTLGRVQQAFEQNPGETALYLAQNEQFFGKKLVDEAWAAWMNADPRGFATYQRQAAQYEWEQQRAQQQAPIEQYTYQQISNSAVAEAGQGIPDWEQYKPLIWDAIEQNPHIEQYVKSVTHDPAQLAQAIQWVYGVVKGNEYVQQLRAQPQQGQETPAVDSQKARARTETRSTAPPEQNASRDKALQDMILNARP